jgi:hypothetical protein
MALPVFGNINEDGNGVFGSPAPFESRVNGSILCPELFFPKVDGLGLAEGGQKSFASAFPQFVGRDSQSLFNRPATIESADDGCMVNFETLCPFNDMEGFPSKFNDVGSSGISELLSRRGPAAIFGAVISVVVFAVKRVPLGRPRPHVGEEVLESALGVAPAFADFDAPTPIVLIRFGIVGFMTASTHVTPGNEFGAVDGSNSTRIANGTIAGQVAPQLQSSWFWGR